MKCTRDKTCTGGNPLNVNFTHVSQNLTYNCGAACNGALLIDCCTTCARYRSSPGELEVDRVECIGCEEASLVSAAESIHCQLVDGSFHCAEMDSCATGVLEKTCEVSKFVCNIYDCGDSCHADEQLRARCCSDCLQKMCYGTADRMICQGCDVDHLDLPSSLRTAPSPAPSPSGWPFFR